MAIPIALTRQPDDALALRASVGGDPTIGYYLIFRGDPETVVKMLEKVTAIAKEALPRGDYADKRGRPQG
jgi:hypothetical protein